MFQQQQPPNPYGLPSLESLERLSAPEVGLRVLRMWKTEDRIRVPTDFARSAAESAYNYPDSQRAALILMEGLSYLIREGLIVRDPGQSSDFYTLSRTGRSVKAESATEGGLPRQFDAREVLHPLIASVALPELERGREYYADAVFKAYKQVEIVVRKRSKLDDIGVSLMRAAFKKGGPLAESGVNPAEAEALSHLYTGAIGRFKNPGSHRDVEESDVRVAFQLLAFASYLITQLERISGTDEEI
jgi:uncharacterized protein (TIGR02391 family)